MHVLIYEFVTGGGWYSSAGDAPPPDSLVCEGRTMLAALAADFCAIKGTRVSTLHDVRAGRRELPSCEVHAIASAAEEQAVLAELAAAADWTIVIAPEFSGFLYSRAQAVIAAGGRLLGPSPQLIEIAADKDCTAKLLAAAGVPVPQGCLVAATNRLPRSFPYPAVLKPVDGAGSQGIRLIEGSDLDLEPRETPHRLEHFCPGVAASVALLCGPKQQVALPPCRQLQSDDGRFTYLGGSLPLTPTLAARTTRLARRTAAALPDPFGYIGIDLVLGPDENGRDDVVIEVNPRLTTSYVGLRAATTDNLAAAMLDVAQGREPTLSFNPDPLQFDAAGNIRRGKLHSPYPPFPISHPPSS